MSDTTVHVKGLRELNRDFRKLSKDLTKELRQEMRELAEPVADDVRDRAAEWGPTVVRGIAAGTSRGGAVVRQRNRKTTGLHPEFGALQMREAFVPAAERHRREVEAGVERLLDRLTRENDLD